jgi:hypothetical protein
LYKHFEKLIVWFLKYYLYTHQVIQPFHFFFLILEIELIALHLLSKLSTTWAISLFV